MNAPVNAVYLGPPEHVAGFEELEVVRLLQAVADDEGRLVPAGSSGTVVAIWAGGEAYDVEFERPFHSLATVEAKLLEPARPNG